MTPRAKHVQELLNMPHLSTPARTRLCLKQATHDPCYTHSCFYTPRLLHTDAFLQNHFYTDTLLHTSPFTQRRFCTPTLLQRNPFTHTHHSCFYKPFRPQSLLHADAFTHSDRHFCTQTLLHAHPFHTQTRLHANAFTRRFFTTPTLVHKHFYTQMLLHKRFYSLPPPDPKSRV